ncbi:Putative DNA-binding protein in cluster with Type I restriction-modification system [Alloactinosynnema sp. L-07]|uniref:helix-turn-helix domain-containing protein n=1 Tax=Alloactinosynnema sp. L-07 TaxID=1653480 RepID=UPI00065EF4B5|nr:helix-turn-helix transcriptional regulator [Alloactinosynnema sp. L-07]CRK58932.1 Putative DNA-binding protein in cluster with Type I restriction-modification system [Alloactinosynnema sp. L-07]
MAERRNDGQSTGPTARRIVLGSQLRKLREKAEVSRGDAGYTIRGSESKISRMELGRVGFKERDVEDLLTMYGVTDALEREQFLALVKQSNEPGWWHRYSDLMPNWFTDYVGLEESASRIQTCELQFVPGLLQTEEYTRVLASHGRPERASDETERRVTLRMSRQKVLHRTDAPKLWAVIDESVLHRPIGGQRVLRDQIDHLLEVTRLPNITLQVVPFALSGYAAETSFTMLRFTEPELPDLVYVEHLGGAVYLDRREEIELYSRVVDRLAVDSETPNRSRQILAKRRAEI